MFQHFYSPQDSQERGRSAGVQLREERLGAAAQLGRGLSRTGLTKWWFTYIAHREHLLRGLRGHVELPAVKVCELRGNAFGDGGRRGTQVLLQEGRSLPGGAQECMEGAIRLDCIRAGEVVPHCIQLCDI